MKEPYGKGIANHSNPESCAGHGNMTGEALIRAHAGQPLSSEITFFGVPTLYLHGEGYMSGDAIRKTPQDVAESKTLSMRGNSMNGNWETLETPAPQGAGRSEKVNRRTSDMLSIATITFPV